MKMKNRNAKLFLLAVIIGLITYTFWPWPLIGYLVFTYGMMTYLMCGRLNYFSPWEQLVTWLLSPILLPYFLWQEPLI